MRTQDLITCAFDELAASGGGPAAIVGDLNCEAGSIPAIHHAVSGGLWHDAALMPHIGNPAEPLGTCLSPSASEYQRRDYVFLNNDAVGLVQAFEVVTDSLYQVHRPLRITFRHPDGPRTIKAPLVTRSFSDAAKLEKDPEETRRLIRYHIDRRLVEVEHALRAMLADWDTTGFWLGWSAAVEQGFCDGLRITGDKRRGFGGHGTVGTVELALDHAMPAADSVQAETGLLRLQGPAMRLARYHRQLMSLEEALRASGKPRPGAWSRLLWAKWRPVAVQPDNYGIDFDLVHRVLLGLRRGGGAPCGRAGGLQRPPGAVSCSGC